MTLTRRNVLTQGARAVGIVALSLPLAGIASFEALFAPKAELWPRWQAHDPASSVTIDHTAWDRLLSVYLRDDGRGLNRFDYGGVSASDRAALDTYIEDLAGVPIDDFNRDEQFAYWVNLYNALTVQVVLNAYPVDKHPRYRYLTRPVRRWSVGQGTGDDRGRSDLAQRYRTSHPAADMARSPHPLRGQLRLYRLPQFAASGLYR